MVVESSSSNNNDESLLVLTTQFQQLIERGCQILHHFDGFNWNVVDKNLSDNKDGTNTATAAAAGGGEVAMNNVGISSDDDDQSDSSSDDGMMMFGGGLLDSDSDNDDDDVVMDSGLNNNGNNDQGDDEDDDYYEEENGGEEYEEEDDAALLKRASSVHVALLTSSLVSTTSSSSSSLLVKDGKELVTTLISSITTSSASSSTTTTTAATNNNHDDDDVNKLITTISNILHQSSTNYLPKRMSIERKRKIGLTNSLLAVQYLLCVLDHSSSSSTTSTLSSSSLLGWKMIILPLLFNNNNNKLDEALQTALLNLISPTSIIRRVTNDQLDYCEDVCQLCLRAVDRLTTTTTATTTSTSVSNSTAMSNNHHQRQSQLVLVSNVLIRLHDGMNKLLIKQQQQRCNQRSGGAVVEGTELELTLKCVESVVNAIHLVILKVIRGICYATAVDNDNKNMMEDNEKYVILEPLLSLEAVRPITGMLLPTLYYPSNGIGGSGNCCLDEQQEVRVVELWNEILRLLSPCAEEVVVLEENRKCCRNWESVAPMTATAVLCILLPSFRGMELPTVPTTGDNNNWASPSPPCRPVFQPSVWALIRQSLKRCGDTDSSGEGGDSGGRGTSLLSRGARDGGSSTFGYDDDVSTYDRAAIDQLLRRRSAHILRLLIEYERDNLLRNGSKKKGKGKGRQGKDVQDGSIDKQKRADMWMKYVLCFEMLEMEIEIHLVDQVWTTVKELSSEASMNKLEEGNDPTNELPPVLWEDVASLLCRVLLSDAPTLRKLGLYRFLCGDTGIRVTSDITEENQDDNNRTFMRKAESKCKVKKKSGGASVPITIVSVSFVLDVVMRSYDSIVGTKVGTNMQIDEGGQQKSEKVADRLSEFLSNYVIALAESSEDGSVLSEFMTRILSVITTLKWRSLVLLFRAVATAIDQSTLHKYTLEQESVRAAIKDMLSTFSSGGAPRSLQEGLRQDLSSMLKNAVPWKRPDASIVLDVLSLYPPQDDFVDNTDSETYSLTRSALATWILGLGDGQWANNAAPVCASAFVMGEMLPFNEKVDILSGVNTHERTMGMAISLLCTLTGNASEMLWPAIFKGLQKPPSASSHKSIRSMILLEWGCREEALSGMGNGDIVTDKQNRMLPPPPNVEFLLNHAVQLLLSQVMEIKTSLGGRAEKSGASRSSASGQASSYIYTLINQIRVLHLSFPSSASISHAVNAMLKQCADSLQQSNSGEDSPIDTVVTLTLCYASLSCDAKFEDAEEMEQLLSICEAIMAAELSQVKDKSMRRDAVQALRSIFHYSKWGSLSLIVPMINEAARKQPGAGDAGSGIVEQMYEKILNSANEAVDSTPVIALPPLFACTTSCGEYLVELEDASSNGMSLLSSIKVISETLFAVLKEETTSSTWMHMLSSMCNLLFNPKLLLHEYQKSYVDGDRDNMPVMKSFGKLIEMGSALRPHINIVAVSYISVAWLGSKDSSDQDAGVAAIPYRDKIAELLVYKEPKFDESSANQNSTKHRHSELPQTTDGSSITRAFVLSFLSKLPSPENLSDVVLKQLVHHIVLKLIDACCLPPAKGKPFITGSEEYSKMMRSWQALCLLSRFVTSDIANEVAQKVFQAMSNLSHGQIRYFMECFTIQCTRKHPSIFGQTFISEIRRNDLSLQYVSSLMIIGGNVTVGRYSNDFFHSKSDKKIKEILCGVLPWLSSTQGFSRAIAQLLVYKLIPLVVDVEKNNESGAIEQDDAVLRSVYMFLQQNQDMSRVRVKQMSFFDSYDVETACQFEGLLTSFGVDDGDEASPVHMVDAIKECLADVYKEVHDEDAPEWKQIEDLLITAEGGNQDSSIPDNDELVNFQRKILPVDALDLRIKSLHENKKFNAAGNKKQSLIVCATLVDKVPNLAGLARTAEIFAAETLVLPNTLVKKQDDFKSISASANDWIDMEECKEEQLLAWLHKKKSQGYTIVGLEQTSSSKCLTRFNFPDKVVLLLGKEKEGIPVEFLSAVDQCIEIPQLGIIRSLNVHVSGALTIWEYTSQMMKRSRK